MSPDDLRVFCTALGFTAVIMRSEQHTPDMAGRAVGFANLIEAFCQHALPAPAYQDKSRRLNDLGEKIDALKRDLRQNGSADLDLDRATLLQLYDGLRQRYAAYASDDMIADRILELIDAEIGHDERRPGNR